MVKAVFIDIDGTLVNSQKIITENTKNLIQKCMDIGIKIILSSGRARSDALKYQKEIKSSPYIISSNGAEVYDIEKNMEIYAEPLGKEVLEKLLNYINENDEKITLNYGSEMAINKVFYPDEEDKQKSLEEILQIIQKEKVVQCVIASRELEKLQNIKTYLLKEIPEVKIENESKRLKNPNLKPSKHYFCDITSSMVSKGKAVEALCKYLQFKEDEIVVIGDGQNDISMFEKAKFSVAMRNAMEDVKQKARYVTSSNDEEGVAIVLEKILR